MLIFLPERLQQLGPPRCVACEVERELIAAGPTGNTYQCPACRAVLRFAREARESDWNISGILVA